MLVIKIGGSVGNDVANVATAVKGLEPCVVVHGGSSAVDELCVRLGHPPKRLMSSSGFESRYTDAETLDAVTMAMAGQLNVRLVAAFQAEGVNAVGLSGVDGRLFVGRRKSVLRIKGGDRTKIIRDDRSGAVESVNVDLLQTLLAAGYVPVLSPPILDGEEGGPLNADADRVAAKVASLLAADTLVLLTNVPGLLGDPADPGSLVHAVPREELDRAIGAASGGMKKKLLAAREALEGGVARVVIADSRCADPVRAALQGEGTVIA